MEMCSFSFYIFLSKITLPSLYFVQKESVHDTYEEKYAKVEAEAGQN